MQQSGVGLGADYAAMADLDRQGEGDDSEPGADLLPWVKGVLLVGWWGVVAVVVASVFFFGAFVGGLK